jgi:hypothetical protein
MDAAKDIHKEMLPIWAAFLCAHMGSIPLWISFASIFFAHKNAQCHAVLSWYMYSGAPQLLRLYSHAHTDRCASQ